MFCPFNDGFQETDNLLKYLRDQYSAFWHIESDQTLNTILSVILPELSKVLVYINGMNYTFLVSGYIDINTSKFTVERCYAVIDDYTVLSVDDLKKRGQCIPQAILQHLPSDITYDESIISIMKWETPQDIIAHLDNIIKN